MTKRKLTYFLPVLLALLAATAAFAATKSVNINANSFSPRTVTIDSGDSVRWTNKDSANHQVVAENGSFSSPVLGPNKTYSQVFNVAGTYRYRDALKTTTPRGTVVVKGPPPSVSAGLSAPIIVYGQTINIGGQVSNKRANERVEIFHRPFGQASYVKLGEALTTTDGVYGFPVKPELLTDYQTVWKNLRSIEVRAAVQPRVVFNRKNGIFSVKVTAGRSYFGRYVYVQRLSSLGQWVNQKKVYLNRENSKLFRMTLKKGLHRLRIFMTINQAGSGYLSGQSTVGLVRIR